MTLSGRKSGDPTKFLFFCHLHFEVCKVIFHLEHFEVNVVKNCEHWVRSIDCISIFMLLDEVGWTSVTVRSSQEDCKGFINKFKAGSNQGKFTFQDSFMCVKALM